MNLDDNTIAKLTLNDMQLLFTIAARDGNLTEFNEQFWSAINRVRSNENIHNMQKIVHFLDDYKRRLGATYSKHCAPAIKEKYNDLETVIRSLVSQYNVKRKYKDYYLA